MLENDAIRRCKNRLALAFIVKNEGRYAVEMLESVLPLVGFVSFADTGSSDDTVEVISSYLERASVRYEMRSIQFTEFGVARNAALDLVPPEFDWVLMLDCDEIILSADHLRLCELIEQSEHDAWRLARYNWDTEMWGSHHKYPDFQARLFRNSIDHRIRYVGEIHEQLTGYVNCGYVSTTAGENENFAESVHIHHIKLFRKSAQELHDREVLYQSFYNAQRDRPQVVSVPQPEPVAFLVAPGGIANFDSGLVRKIHALSLEEFDHPGVNAFWCEWNHASEQTRTLEQIVDFYVEQGWPSLIRPGATCIDIGAHSGDTTVPIGLFCSDFRRNVFGRVYAFEPNPDLFPVLRLNLALNSHVCEFIPVQMAVIADRNREASLSDHGNGNCNGGIVDDSFSGELTAKLRESARVTYVAQGVNLETIYRELLSIADRRRLEFIKINASGYEKEIIRGSRNLFKMCRPIIHINWFDLFLEQDSADLFLAVEEIGYTALEAPNGEPASVHRRVSNLVLYPNS